MSELEITGLRELQEKLENLSKDAGDKCIRTALKAGAEIEAAAITEAAPVKVGDGGILPDGALKSDIGFKIKQNAHGGFYAIIEPGKYTKRVARWVEYGHRLVTGGYSRLDKKTGKTRGPGTVIGQVKEHPFIRPTYESTKSQVAKAITTTLATEIDKAAKKDTK